MSLEPTQKGELLPMKTHLVLIISREKGGVGSVYVREEEGRKFDLETQFHHGSRISLIKFYKIPK